MKTKRNRSILLISLQLFLGLGAIFGGLAFIMDPSGEILKIPTTLLERSPFNNFLIPGIILFVVLGLFPIMISLALMKKWHWALGEQLNVFKDRHWSWTFSLYSGFAIIIWISVQVYMLNSVSLVHLFYIALGLIIQGSTLLPSVQDIYKK
ncbi:hypothetical protein D3C76_1102280 [compost metagenome]